MEVKNTKNNLHITLTEFRNESRILKEANSLLNHGVVQTVYVAALHAESLAVDQNYGNRLVAHRFKLSTRQMPKNIFAQIVKYLEFCFSVCSYYKKKEVKIVNVHSLGLLPLGIALKYLYGATLIYDAHELETEKNGDRGFRKKFSKWLEGLLINRVDMTIVVSESIADWYAKAYSMTRPPVILNAPNRRDLIKTNHFRNDLGIREDQVIFLYQGGLASGRGIDLIMDAFKSRDGDNAVVVFMGYGPLTDKIKKHAADNKNIFYFPAVSPEIVLEYTASADIGLALIENTCLSYFYCMPNKLFEYAMAGLPVLVSNMKDMSALVKEYKMGGVIKDFSIAGINQAIDEILKFDLGEMKNNAYRAACDHAWEIQERKLIAAYEKYGIYTADNLVREV
jgi:glycosyltransferase involved in cell wall biosynthesis